MKTFRHALYAGIAALAVSTPGVSAAQLSGTAPPVVADRPGDWIDTRTITGAVEYPRTLDAYTPFIVLRTDDGARYWVDLRPSVPHRADIDIGDRLEVNAYATTRPDVLIAVDVAHAEPRRSPERR